MKLEVFFNRRRKSFYQQYHQNKFNSELIYSTKNLKAGKKINTKGGFHCKYTPIALIDSIYRKDENVYPKVFL